MTKQMLIILSSAAVAAAAGLGTWRFIKMREFMHRRLCFRHSLFELGN